MVGLGFDADGKAKGRVGDEWSRDSVTAAAAGVQR